MNHDPPADSIGRPTTDPGRELPRDSHLTWALRHTPDHDLQPPTAIDEQLRRMARQPVPSAPADRRPHTWPAWRARWQGLLQSLTRPAAGAAFASLALGTAIVTLWRDQPVPSTQVEAPGAGGQRSSPPLPIPSPPPSAESLPPASPNAAEPSMPRLGASPQTPQTPQTPQAAQAAQPHQSPPSDRAAATAPAGVDADQPAATAQKVARAAAPAPPVEAEAVHPAVRPPAAPSPAPAQPAPPPPPPPAPPAPSPRSAPPPVSPAEAPPKAAADAPSVMSGALAPTLPPVPPTPTAPTPAAAAPAATLRSFQLQGSTRPASGVPDTAAVRASGAAATPPGWTAALSLPGAAGRSLNNLGSGPWLPEPGSPAPGDVALRDPSGTLLGHLRLLQDGVLWQPAASTGLAWRRATAPSDLQALREALAGAERLPPR